MTPTYNPADTARLLAQFNGTYDGLSRGLLADPLASALSACEEERKTVTDERDRLLDGRSAVLPKTLKHAQNLYTVAVACLKEFGQDPESRLTALEAECARLQKESGRYDDLKRASEGLRDYLVEHPFTGDYDIPDEIWTPFEACVADSARAKTATTGEAR